MPLPEKIFTKQNIIDLEKSISELKSRQSLFTYEKKKCQDALSEINSKIKSNGKHLPPAEYKKLCNKQDSLKREITEAEHEIANLQDQIRKKSHLADEIKLEVATIAKKDMPNKITKLKDYYMNFAADKTRVSSMRAMAAEFAEKLEAISREF